MLPGNAVRPTGETLGFQDYVDDVERGAQRIMSGEFDVYLDDGRLTYVREGCGSMHREARFFLWVHPVDGDVLAPHRRRRGFDGFHFTLDRNGLVAGDRCLVLFDLPRYDIAAIRTGQRHLGDGAAAHPFDSGISEGCRGPRPPTTSTNWVAPPTSADGLWPGSMTASTAGRSWATSSMAPSTRGCCSSTDLTGFAGYVGSGFLTSLHPVQGAATKGRAVSPVFWAEADDHLALLVAGGTGGNAHVLLVADEEPVAIFHGTHTNRLTVLLHPLAEVANRPLTLELVDEIVGGRVMLDHVLLMRREVLRSVDDRLLWRQRFDFAVGEGYSSE